MGSNASLYLQVQLKGQQMKKFRIEVRKQNFGVVSFLTYKYLKSSLVMNMPVLINHCIAIRIMLYQLSPIEWEPLIVLCLRVLSPVIGYGQLRPKLHTIGAGIRLGSASSTLRSVHTTIVIELLRHGYIVRLTMNIDIKQAAKII